MFVRERPNQLWVTDITEHPSREGKVYCAVVLDAFSRRIVGWSISHNPTAALTSNALGMAIEQRDAQRGETVIHSDHGTQSPPGRSPSGHAIQGSCLRWARSETVTTTR
jgi:putative transposase